MNINKNISVWRGDSTPPTNYHFWIKADGSLLVYNGAGWADYHLYIANASLNEDGFMSKEDKIKLDTLNSTILYKFRGSIKNIVDLPENPGLGDTYNVVNEFTFLNHRYPAGTNISWNGSQWDPLGGIVEFDEINDKISAVDKRVDETNEGIESYKKEVELSMTAASALLTLTNARINQDESWISDRIKNLSFSSGNIKVQKQTINSVILNGKVVTTEGNVSTTSVPVTSLNIEFSQSSKAPNEFVNSTFVPSVEYITTSEYSGYIAQMTMKAYTDDTPTIQLSYRFSDDQNGDLYLRIGKNSKWGDYRKIVDSSSFKSYFNSAIEEMNWEVYE